jgi:hypothetical protein
MEATNANEIIDMPPDQTGRAERETARARKHVLATLAVFGVAVMSGLLIMIPVRQWSERQQMAIRVETVLGEVPVFRAVRDASPAAFNAYRDELATAIRQGYGGQDLRKDARAFAKQAVERCLRRGSPETLRRVVALREQTVMALLGESPVACYQFLTTSEVTGHNANLLADYHARLGEILTARLADSPLPRDDARAKRQADALLRKLSADELGALNYPDKPWTDSETFCRAVLKLYRGALALPDADCARVLRYLHLLPEDDRA